MNFRQFIASILGRLSTMCGTIPTVQRKSKRCSFFLMPVGMFRVAPIFFNLLKGPASAYDPVIKDTEELMSLALKCIYACDRFVYIVYYVASSVSLLHSDSVRSPVAF